MHFSVIFPLFKHAHLTKYAVHMLYFGVAYVFSMFYFLCTGLLMGHFLIVKKYLFASCCIVLCMASAHFCMCSACHIKGDCLHHLLLFPCFCLLFTIIKLLHIQGVATFIAQIFSQNILENVTKVRN